MVKSIAWHLIAMLKALSDVRNTNKRNRYHFADGLYEKNIDTLSITGNELSYKFPIDDIIYTIDEVSMQPSSPAPLISFTTRNG